MAAANFVQTSFAGGKWSPFSQGRFDDPAYRTALAECKNGYPIETKAWSRRPGTQFCGATNNGDPGRLIPFSFEDNEPYNIELTDLNLRFFNGPDLLTDAVFSVSSISTAIPAVVTMASAPGWASGIHVLFALQDTAAMFGVPALANRVFLIGKLTSTTYQLFDGITGDPIDGSTIGWGAGFNVSGAHITRLAAPWDNGSWANVRPIQNETNMLLLEGNTATQLLTAIPALGTAQTQFSIAPANFQDGPYLDPFGSSTVTPDVVSGFINLTLSNPVYGAAIAYAAGDYVTASGITYVSLVDSNVGNTPASSPTFWMLSSPGAVVGIGGITSDDIGRHVRLYSEPPLWVTGTTYAIGDQVAFGGGYWTALAAMVGATPTFPAVNPNQPGVKTTTWQLTPTSAIWSWGKVTGIPTTGLIDPATAATKFGNLTGNGGIAAAFDGITSQPVGSCAYLLGGGSVTPLKGYVGLSFAAATAVTSVQVTPSNNIGYGDTLNGSLRRGSNSTTFNLRGKTTSPANSADGTLLGTANITNSASKVPVSIVSNDTSVTYKFIWVEIVMVNQYADKSTIEIAVAELRLYGAGAAAAGSVCTVELLGPPLLFTTTIRTWRLGLFNNADPVWPTSGCYHEGRLWLAGAVDNRFDASVANDFLNFAPTNSDGTVSADRAIDYTVDSSDLNKIFWMSPDTQGIVVGTIGGEWLIDSPAQGGFAPDNIRARRMTKFGCANVEPRRTGLTNVFVQRRGQKIMEFLADVYSGKFVGKNLSEYGRDLCLDGVEEIAYTQEIDPIIWSRTGAGNLNGLSYHRTSIFSATPPDLMAWHEHSLGSGRVIESIAASASLNGQLDVLTLITNDPETGIRHVEIMTPLFDENSTIFDAWFLDDAVVPVSGLITNGGVNFYGLSHLNGKKISVWAAGLDCGDFTVAGGFVSVPFGSAGGLFTQRYLTQVSSLDSYQYGVPITDSTGNLVVNIPAVVGFTYTSQGQLLRPVAQDQTGSPTGPAFGVFRRPNMIGVLMNKSQGVSFGTDFVHMHPAILVTDGGRVYSQTELFSGIYWNPVEAQFTFEGQLAWQVTRPYPLVIQAIGGFMKTG